MRVLVTGAASSGKSQAAEGLALALPGPHVYVATMPGTGAEGAARVRRHREARAGKGFFTFESFGDLGDADPDGALDAVDGRPIPPVAGGTVLIECLGNVVANTMFADGDGAAGPRAVAEACVRGATRLAERFAHAVIVANEVGCDGRRYDAGTSGYIEALGAASCALAARADAVVEVSCGCPVALLGEEVLRGVAPWMR